jgi:DNA-binding HxlR family transcriptional regulator
MQKIPSLEKKPGCIQAALKIIGEKWTALIIRDLYYGSKRFNQLQHSLPGISPRTLSQRLLKLEECKVILKQKGEESLGYPEYSLTQKGSDFAGILQQMADWGAKYQQVQSIKQ